MALKKLIKWIAPSVLVLGILILVLHHLWLKHEAKPIINPQPQYFVTIKGNIQPNMPYPMTVMYRATYGGYNPKCAVHGSWLNMSGLDYMPGKPVYYPIHPDKQGNYIVKIPIDAYLPGKCQWKLAWIMQAFVPKIPPKKEWSDSYLWGDMIGFGKRGNPQESPGYPITTNATFYCGTGGLDKCIGSALQGGYVNQPILRSKNYYFTQNIKAKKETNI